ncbi:MAG: long-chain fatty acid--CoA ligase [Bacteroidales bacterium]|nr:long-chain fatty acid--CoA ligase [Bacteroidales bacterium]
MNLNARPIEKLDCFNAYIQNTIQKYFNNTALSDYNRESYTFGEIGYDIYKLHAGFKAIGIKAGDKIALLGKSSANWCKIYLATITYGAVIIPILPDFKPSDVHTIINHSESILLFSEESIYKTLNLNEMQAISMAIRMKDYTLLESKDEGISNKFINALDNFTKANPNGIKPKEIVFPKQNPDDLLVISYTSGTTGFSKGVMLPERSLRGNIDFARKNMTMYQGEQILSILPLAHAFGCTVEFLFPFTLGCHITFLARIPSPTIMIEAFEKVKPNLILAVPLIIEKIYTGKIKPILSKPFVKFILKIPILRKLFFNKIKSKLTKTLGGKFRELVIGGAPLNPETEKFLKKIHFPFTVGYGMTECGPLISYASWNTTVLHGSGKAVDEQTVRIDSPDPLNIAGEILLKGSHVMLGYYKNEEITKSVIDEDGWLHTGDIGVLDKKGNIIIHGRLKNMILSSSGQNIYPEEIESLLANYPLISESLVVDRKNKPVAILYPNQEYMQKHNIKKIDLHDKLEKIIKNVNENLPTYSQISNFEIKEDEFEKTPKRSIKRFKYQ